MIRADTKPGTPVVCIDDSPGPYGSVEIHVNYRYTIRKISRAETGGYCAFLHEVKPRLTYDERIGMVFLGFGLHRFKYLGWEKFEHLLRGLPILAPRKRKHDVVH